ncbi:ABC-three component system protein [Mucilaginibacter sp. AW1-3]
MADQFRPYTVIVNSGSGCLIQPLSEDYSYVLTARHNIANAGGALNILQRAILIDPNTWQMADIPFAALVLGTNYFPHPQYDIALIKIGRLPGLDNIYRTDQIDQQVYHLTGYPDTRRLANPNQSQEWYRCDSNLTIFGSNNGAREAQIPGNPDQTEVEGQSGGPILFEREGKILLVGIEIRMAAAVGEQLGRIIFYPVAAFDQIIIENSDQLTGIAPSFMRCFSFLANDVFKLEAGFYAQNVVGIKSYLLYKAQQVTRDECTPNAIRSFFKQRLLLDKQPEEVLSSKEIWCTWLEFLTIMNILRTTPVDMGNLEDVFNSVRLLFSASSEDWSTELNNMIYSDYKGLNDNGVVVIGMSKSPINNEYVIDAQKIPMIGQARNSRDRSKILINEGMSFPFDHFKFVHIDYFKGRAIVSKHAEWAALVTDEEFLQKLKLEYEQLFTA